MINVGSWYHYIMRNNTTSTLADMHRNKPNITYLITFADMQWHYMKQLR